MYDNNPIVRFDANHARRIEVAYQDTPTDSLVEDVRNFGLQVVTHYEPLARAMGVDPVGFDDEDDILAEHLAAVKQGEEFRFFVEMYEHTGYAFRIQQSLPKWNFDSRCVGSIFISRKSWQAVFPNIPFDFDKVYEELVRSFQELVTAVFNGEIYEATVFDENGDCEVGFTDHLSAEEALAAAQAEFPDIRFAPEDFDSVTTYTLKPEKAKAA